MADHVNKIKRELSQRERTDSPESEAVGDALDYYIDRTFTQQERRDKDLVWETLNRLTHEALNDPYRFRP